MDCKIYFRASVVLLTSLALTPASAVTIAHDNPHPEIQMWSYPSGSANGAGAVRDRGAIFSSFSSTDLETGEPVFYREDGLSPSRRGTFLIATNTSSDIEPGLAPSRYQIESLRITVTLLGSLIYADGGMVLPYDNTLDSAESITIGSDDDAGHPIEMYGIGLQGDYETIGFETAPVDNAFQLGDVRWRRYREGEAGYDPALPPTSQATAPYQFFAVDAVGRDVENSINGGYSATEPSGETDRFTPTPFGIGKLYDSEGVERAPGSLTDTGDQFVFEPDLTNPGILSYLQNSLAAGHLGFSFSSMDQPAGHDGTIAYPDFYLDDLDIGYNSDGAAPRIELVVSILDPLQPGDFDGNSTVDADDYSLWKQQFGTAGPEADGNGDGIVNLADYTMWRDNLSPAAIALSNSIAVPEPSSVFVLSLGLAVSFCSWVRWYLGRNLGTED